jgi:urea transport system permease protein
MLINKLLKIVFVVLSISLLSPVYGSEPDVSFETTVAQLTTKSFKDKARLIDELAQYDDKRVPAVFDAVAQGLLYYDKSTKAILTIIKSDEGFEATDVVSGKELGVVSKSSVKKIGVNNTLRRQLRSRLALFRLSSADPDIREAAAQEIVKAPSRDFIEPLELALNKESVGVVKDAMLLATASILLSSDDPAERLQAVKTMSDASDSRVVTMLELLVAEDDQGKFSEPDEAVRTAAEAALVNLHTRAKIYKLLEDLFFGISLGSVLLLAAVGLAITFGVMGVINMAHGEMIMLGAYTTYVIQLMMPNQIGLSLVVAIPAAFLVSGLFGVVIERSVIRFLYGRPLETLLATFGISLILQQLVRSVFSPLNRSVITPEWMSGSLHINGMLSLTYNRLYIILFALLVLFGLIQLLKRTFFGLQMRAVMQNRAMASSMGIRTGWVDALTFGLGSGIAGIAGVALSQLTNVGPNLGQAYIIDSFMVVVFGGVGNLLGTFVGAMSLGIVNKFAEPFTGAVLAKILILVFVILFIQRRPRGLFALKGRFVED